MTRPLPAPDATPSDPSLVRLLPPFRSADLQWLDEESGSRLSVTARVSHSFFEVLGSLGFHARNQDLDGRPEEIAPGEVPRDL